MGAELSTPTFDFSAWNATKATLPAAKAAAAAADATALAQATAATKAANEAKWNLNHPTRYAFAGDTVMTLGMDSVYAKKKLLGE